MRYQNDGGEKDNDYGGSSRRKHRAQEVANCLQRVGGRLYQLDRDRAPTGGQRRCTSLGFGRFLRKLRARPVGLRDGEFLAQFLNGIGGLRQASTAGPVNRLDLAPYVV